MCGPMAAFGIGAGIQGVQGLWDYREQYMAAKDLANYQEAQAAAIAAGVKADNVRSYAASARTQREIQKSVPRELMELARATRSAQGQLSASAGSAGVEGTSIEQLFDDFTRQELARIEVSRENAASAMARQEDADYETQKRAERILAESRPQPVQTPSLFGTLLSIGGGIAQSYMMSGLASGGGGVTPSGSGSLPRYNTGYQPGPAFDPTIGFNHPSFRF